MFVSMKNIVAVVIDQGPPRRFIRNFFITRNAWGVFSRNSHVSQRSNTPKVKYNTKASAEKAANAMAKKYGGHYSNYKCLFCDGYHVGMNRSDRNERSSVPQTTGTENQEKGQT